MSLICRLQCNRNTAFQIKKLYIGNLDLAINEFAITKLFKTFGKITFIELMVHRSGTYKGQSKGYCFLDFETEEQASNAINALNGKLIRGRPIVVSYARMTAEEERKRRHHLQARPTTAISKQRQTLKNISTDVKIKAIEKKLELLKKAQAQRSPSSTTTSSTTASLNKSDTQ
ncbi:hypothetical protein BDF20DRAFT_837987 [Mycotypha africana]|uniref:uncharacterized protein n=1 Tax=Mycotypha africana TaxID=64632 RepID=UPI0023014EAD|nr:uncharacterized protein BDF20DRAFT_837987 [Mycotypha africana]KAI8971687.1 hypothetical protein BDF20DRAFT_837987 [Mycotypha africana]